MITDRQRIDMAKAHSEVPKAWSDEKVLRYFRVKATIAAERLEQMGIKR